jgi:hypothetical protein
LEGECDVAITKRFGLMAGNAAAFATKATSEVVPRNKKKELVSTEGGGSSVKRKWRSTTGRTITSYGEVLAPWGN